MKIMTSFIFFYLLFGTTSPLRAQSNAELEGCSATVFKMPDMLPSDKALVLSNGHCLVLELPMNAEASSTKELVRENRSKNIFLYNSDLDLGKIFRSQRILYASMGRWDLAIIELPQTYADLARLNYKVAEIAESSPKIGEVLSFHSFYKQNENLCQIESLVPALKESFFNLKNVLKLKMDSKCQMEHGHSGTAGMKDQKIHALVFTRNDGNNSPCTLHNPCEVSKGTSPKPPIGQMYAFSTSFLHRCYNRSSRTFDFNLKTCKEEP